MSQEITIESVPIAELKEYRDRVFPAALRQREYSMFLIDNHEKWIQPQAFEWFRKARDNMDFSKDPPRVSPSIDQLQAYKDFFFPAPLLWDEQNTYEDWEEWASCYVLAEFLKTR